MANAVKTLQNEISNSGIEVEKLKAAKESIRNISLVKEPQVSFAPVGPKKKQDVLFAGIMSLMFGVFLAFFAEYWEKSKQTETSKIKP